MIRAQGLDAAMGFLKAAPTLAQVAVNSAMVSGEYAGEMRRLAGESIAASVPASHAHLVEPLTKLVRHDSTRSVMSFWLNPAVVTGSGLTDHDLVDAVLAVGMDDIEQWVRQFKEIKEVDLMDGKLDYDAIASRVWFAKENKPAQWIHMKSGNRSLLANSGALSAKPQLGLASSDTDVVSAALENVLAAWTRYLARVVPERIVANLETQLA